MGYGVKTDYLTGRVLDLDKTYHNVIKPAVESAGLICIRADEVRHSGIIDVPMYEHLINADVVIADLSTYNPNAFYELGVRHALRPFTTIAISENELQQPFDVNHTVIRKYEHLGKDIGCSEAARFIEELRTAILEIIAEPKTDSPVYTYLPLLQPPSLNGKPSLYRPDESKDSLSTIITKANTAFEAGEYNEAITLFKLAGELDQNNSYIVQKLALVTYKSKLPSPVVALNNALAIIEQLDLETSTDPETLGLAGAIYKRLWDETQLFEHLSSSIEHYEKGYLINNDYYTGINLAYLLNVRSSVTADGDDAVADRVLAKRVRLHVVELCEQLCQSANFVERGDRYWIMATLEEAHFGLRNQELYEEAKLRALALPHAKWERESTQDQLGKLGTLLKIER